MFKLTLYALTALFSYSLAYSQTAPHSEEPLTFNAWKSQQVLEAQWQVQKWSSQLTAQRMGRSKAAPEAEKELKAAREAFQTASELTLEEYISVYLVGLQADPKLMSKLLDKFTKEESAEVILWLVKKRETPSPTPNSATRKQPLALK